MPKNAEQLQRIAGILRHSITSKLGKREEYMSKLDAAIDESMAVRPWQYSLGIPPHPETTRKLEHWLILSQMRYSHLNKKKQEQLTKLILAFDAKSIPLSDSEGLKFFEQLGIEPTKRAHNAFCRALSMELFTIRDRYTKWHFAKKKTRPTNEKLHVLDYAEIRVVQKYFDPIVKLFASYMAKKGVLP